MQNIPMEPMAGGTRPDNYLVWAILSTLFCCLPAGIVSIVYAAQVNGKWEAGDYAGAQASSDNARKWAMISAIVGVAILVLYIIFFVAIADFGCPDHDHGPGTGHPSAGSGPAPHRLNNRVAAVLNRMANSPVAPFVVAAAALAVCVTLAVRDPREEGSYGTCPWLLVTGTHCPGCGTLRCISRLTQGDLVGAAGYNIFTVLAIPVMVVQWARWAFPTAVGRRIPPVNHASSLAIWGFLVFVLSFWLVRNLPYDAVRWLAP